jgi:hypothetical protein
VHDLRGLLRVADGRVADGRGGEPAAAAAAIFDGRVIRSTPGSGGRGGRKRRKGSKGSRGRKVHMAVGTPGRLLAPGVTAAEGAGAGAGAVKGLAGKVRAVTGGPVELAYVGQGDAGDDADAAADAQERGIRLEVVKHAGAKRGFVPPPPPLLLLPRRWGGERSFAWMARSRRLARDYGRLPRTPAGLHFAAPARLMPARLMPARLMPARTAKPVAESP